MAELALNRAATFPILVVEDNLLLRNMLEGGLKAAGYEVVTAANGREGLELFRSGYYPIVMTDWVMPEMDGLELCRAIRSDSAGHYTYIILLTSLDSKNDIIAGLEAGADEYLIKPAHQVELLTRLKTARRIIDLESSLQQKVEEIRTLSLVDPLTGIYNRRYMEERLPHELKRAFRYQRSMALILAGIDKFAEVTATSGYYAGDMVVKGFADSLAASVRKDIDWLARYGEAQFAVVLPETDAAGGVILAKRLRIRVAQAAIRHNGREIRISASFGVAGFSASQNLEGLTAEQLLEKASWCLHQAMHNSSEPIKAVQFNNS